ncbi:MAG: hypothetical protein R3B13_04975 [Polyangiaceae bacterium]
MAKKPEKRAVEDAEPETDEVEEDAEDEATKDEDDVDDDEAKDTDANDDSSEAEDESEDDASDDDAEEESEDDEAEAEARARETRRERKRAKERQERARERDKSVRRRPTKPVLPPESQIGAPSRQSLGMIGAMALATLVMWGTAKMACNAHPAQTRKPRALPVAELSKDPKSAALEMAQRWASYDFDGASELATDKVAGEIAAAKDACAKDAACSAAMKKEYDRALASVVLLGRDGAKATVRVTGLGGALEGKTTMYEVELAGPVWKVARATDKAPPPAAPRPVLVPSPPPPGMAGSAAP